MEEDFLRYLQGEKVFFEEALDKLFPSESTHPALIHRAMRYSLMSGGKRIRPVLTLLGAQVVGGKKDEAVAAACAVECIHVYSLIHDDLPAMDDSDLRRGQPTNHKEFGDDMAILAGDGLLTYAFEVLAEHYPDKAAPLVLALAKAAGSDGMVGGQVLDVTANDRPTTKDLLEDIHRRKTGALLRAALQLGGIVGGAKEDQLASLDRYGEKIGLAFQVVDDILEATGADMGKSDTDETNDKLTYPSLYGLDESREMAQTLVAEAKKELEIFSGPPAKRLAELADYIYKREL